jgi:hypothetical protein
LPLRLPFRCHLVEPWFHDEEEHTCEDANAGQQENENPADDPWQLRLLLRDGLLRQWR